MKTALSCLFAVLLIATSAYADYSTEQIQMAASGRFDLLEKSIEARAASQRLQTRDLHALCYAYSKTKRYTKLMDCLDTLAASVQAGDRRTRLFALDDATPMIHSLRAEALIELGSYSEAVAEANKAIQWLKADDSDDLDMLFNALAALSLAHTLSGNEEAGWQAEKVIRDTTLSPFSDYASAKALALARSRMALKDYPGVISAIKENSSFAINVFLDRLLSGSFLTGVNNWVWAELPRAFMLNKALLETGQIAEAKAGLDRLLAIAQSRENGEIYWLLLSDRGRIAEGESQWQEALNYYQQAIDVIETQRASINTEASKIGFVGDKQMLYTRVIELARRLGQSALAFEFIERAKSRALVDLLAGRNESQRLQARDGETQQLLQNYRQATSLAALQLPLDMGSNAANSRILAVGEQARVLQQKAPELASLVTVSALPSSEILRYLRPNEALLEFFGHGELLYGVALNGQESLVLRLEVPQLESDIRAFRKAIMNHAPASNELASRLYQQLIAPFAAVIGKRNLVLVPHGALHYLPFAALIPAQHPLLLERSLRFLPSTSVQKYIRPGGGKRISSILLYGNPDLGNPKFDLPSAEEEAKAIASLFSKAEILTRKQASETSFKKLAGHFPYLHIASHGQFKSEQAMDSRLLLAKDGDNDGSLTVRELYDIRLDADLVTLSACETGLGKALSGDDLVGLTRGFLYAGSSNIVASLWEVDDEATSLLMQAFYTRLKAGIGKQEALRQAQLELRKKHPEPAFWAAFYLTGDGR